MRTSLHLDLSFERWPRLVLLIFCILEITVAAAIFLVRHPPSNQLDASLQEALAALGSQIFHDSELSSDGSVSCATCHSPGMFFTDRRTTARGVAGKVGTRNTPSLLTSRAKGRSSFFWDGRREHLELAVLDPFVNPIEMGLAHHDQLVAFLDRSTNYRKQFEEIFGSKSALIETAQISSALIAYLSSLEIAPTAYDLHVLNPEATPLSFQAQMGLAIFSGKGQCASCHLLKNNILTDHDFHRTSVGLERLSESLAELTTNAMDGPLDDIAKRNAAIDPMTAHLGRFNVTHRVADIGLFVTPSLRHVAETAPYMHDGSLRTLDEVIDAEVYYRGLDTGHPIGLTTQERADLRVFLEAL